MIEVEGDRRVLWEFIFGMQRRRPRRPVPLLRPGPPPPATDRELNAVWYGHASTLLEIEGRRVLLDPVWSRRCSPSHLVGPRRLHPVPVAHRRPAAAGRDPHLARPLRPPGPGHRPGADRHPDRAVRGAARRRRAPAAAGACPTSGSSSWTGPSGTEVAGLTLTATPAQHFSGRGLRRDDTLWGSWVVAGRHRRVFYTGDSGYFDGYAEIGAAHGPFDLTLMQIGAYSPAWPGIHMFPEQAVTAHRELRGGLLIPVHWATFNLSTARLGRTGRAALRGRPGTGRTGGRAEARRTGGGRRAAADRSPGGGRSPDPAGSEHEGVGPERARAARERVEHGDRLAVGEPGDEVDDRPAPGLVRPGPGYAGAAPPRRARPGRPAGGAAGPPPAGRAARPAAPRPGSPAAGPGRAGAGPDRGVPARTGGGRT